MVLNSYSKINLSLNINNKLKSGLHEIQSYFCIISLKDKIKISKINKKKDLIFFKGPFAKNIKRSDNTITKLLKFLRKMKLISNYYSVKVIKNIPVFGGLGGGTSNAAFILRHLLKEKINKNIFYKIEKLIGSDFQLFFYKQGFLENFKTIKVLKKKQKLIFLLSRPNINCSTREIYSKVKKYSKKNKFYFFKINTKKKFMNQILNNRNDLQPIVEKKYPIIKKLLNDINKEKGCYLSRLSGSGSVCYGIFVNEGAAKKALNKIKRKYPRFWFSIAKTV
jgi:4-diphosphocytidyl-2-C-methyl-D-erythritol kinase|tara:strand:- start:56 stop:892 length:837 start_codon:yes stop_codon:yes gene_type:complete